MKRLPSVLATLGIVLDLRVEVDEEIRKLSWRRRMYLCTDAGERRLWLVPNLKRKGPRGDRYDELADVFKDWHQFESDDVLVGTVRLDEPLVRGRVRTLGYRSDKWTREPKDYEHDFDNPPRLTQLGEVYRISGSGVRVTPRGVVG